MFYKNQIFALLCLCLLLIHNQPTHSQNFLITKYSTDNGLPDNRVNDIAQDSLGRIWVAMASGIAMYDGYEWTKYGEKDGVPEVEYIRIKIDKKGVIWFLHGERKGNLVYLKQGKWKMIQIDSPIKNKANPLGDIEVVYENNTPKVFITTLVGGILLYSNGSWISYTIKNGLLSDSITNVFTYKNEVYFSSYKGINKLNKDGVFEKIIPDFENYNRVLSIEANDDEIYTMGIDWIGKINKHRISKLFEGFVLPYAGLNERISLKFYLKDLLIFGSTASVFLLDISKNKITKLILDEPSSDRGATSIFIDYEKNVWISSIRGIYKLTPKPFYNLYKSNGLLENEVSFISEFNNGTILFGHNYGATIKSKNNIKKIQFLNPEKNDARVSRVLSGLHSKINDKIYLTSLENGIAIINSLGNLRWIKNSNIKRYSFIYSNSQNKIIVFTTDGIYELKENYLIKNYKLSISLVRACVSINESDFIVASPSGAYIFKNNNFDKLNSSDPEVDNFYSIFKFEANNLLIGSDKGLFRLENDTLQKFNFNNQDIIEPIYFVIQDSSKNIWLGTNNGVLKWDGKYLKRYNKSDGLAGNETNRAAGFVDSKGNVWIGTDEGISMYTGNEPDYSKFPPKVMLLNFIDYTNKRYSINTNAKLEPTNNNLIFNYRGLSFIDEKANTYQIRLEEIDGDYQNEFLTKSTYARFNNLAPGKYTFSVRVKNSKGIWSEWKNSSIITIDEHFYNEPIFYLSILGALLITAFTLNDYYQQKKYNKRLEKAVEARTKDLKETEQQLITSISRYKGIVESQTDLLIRFDENTILTFVNDAYCATFGKKTTDLIGKSFIPLVHPEDVEATFEELKKIKYPPYRSTIEQRDLTVDGYRWFSWEGYAIHDNYGNVLEIQAVGRDITIQKEVEAELEKRVNERTIELQSLISQSPLGILTFNSDGYLLTYNKIANEMFGSLKDFLYPSKNFNILEDYFLAKNEYLSKLNKLDSPNSFLLTHPILIDEKENKLYYNLYNRYLVYRIYNVVFDESNQMYVLLIDDVTEQQKSEHITKKLLEEKIRISTIIQTIESERDRFAKELHDGLGQLLTTAKLKLDIIKLKIDKRVDEIDETIKILISAGDEIRRIINDLKPSDVERFGLMSSVELLVERIKQASGIKIFFSVLNAINIQNKNTELIVFRIIQEALNNAVKHSQCTKVSVEILTINNQLQVHIGDDGIGYDLSAKIEKAKSYGLKNIKERVYSLNGEIKIETELGKGFQYHIKIPIN